MERDWHKALTHDELLLLLVLEHHNQKHQLDCIERLARRVLELESRPQVVVADKIDTLNM